MTTNDIVDSFAAQFEPDGNGFLYRRNHMGQGVRVTPAERDEALASVRRRIWVSYAAGTVLVLAAVGLALALAPRDTMSLAWSMTGAMGVAIVLFMVLMSRALRAPFAAFERRRKEGEDRQRADVLRQSLGGFDLSTAFFLSLATMLVLLKADHWPPQGLDWLLVGTAAIGPMLALGLGIAKWRVS